MVVTGGPAERDLTARQRRGTARQVRGPGRADQPAELAAVLAGAGAVGRANTGAAHLAAAVGTPVVSLFAPVVPAARWAPYGVPVDAARRPARALPGQPGRASARCPATRA